MAEMDYDSGAERERALEQSLASALRAAEPDQLLPPPPPGRGPHAAGDAAVFGGPQSRGAKRWENGGRAAPVKQDGAQEEASRSDLIQRLQEELADVERQLRGIEESSGGQPPPMDGSKGAHPAAAASPGAPSWRERTTDAPAATRRPSRSGARSSRGRRRTIRTAGSRAVELPVERPQSVGEESPGVAAPQHRSSSADGRASPKWSPPRSKRGRPGAIAGYEPPGGGAEAEHKERAQAMTDQAIQERADDPRFLEACRRCGISTEELLRASQEVRCQQVPYAARPHHLTPASHAAPAEAARREARPRGARAVGAAP